MSHAGDKEYPGNVGNDRHNVASPGRNISVLNDRIDSRDLFLAPAKSSLRTAAMPIGCG